MPPALILASAVAFVIDERGSAWPSKYSDFFYNLADFFGEFVDGIGLGQKFRSEIETTIVDDRVARVARGVENFQRWLDDLHLVGQFAPRHFGMTTSVKRGDGIVPPSSAARASRGPRISRTE